MLLGAAVKSVSPVAGYPGGNTLSMPERLPSSTGIVQPLPLLMGQFWVIGVMGHHLDILDPAQTIQQTRYRQPAQGKPQGPEVREPQRYAPLRHPFRHDPGGHEKNDERNGANR